MALNSNNIVQTFEKGLQILEYIVEHKNVSVTSVAIFMGIQKSASYRFLNTLRLYGYVTQDQHNNYILTDKVSNLGKGIVSRVSFRNIASQFLDELANCNKHQKDLICNLGLWNGKEIVYEAQSIHSAYAQFVIGRTVPAYCSAMGRAILAHLSDEAIDAYIKNTPMHAFTEKTCTTGERLKEELEKVRNTGYASMDGELYLPLKGLAVPLLSESGSVRYTISVTCTSYAPMQTFIDDMLDPLQRTAQDIMSYLKLYEK